MNAHPPASPAAQAAFKRKMTLLTWVGLNPLLILALFALGPLLHSFPMPLRTMLTTAIVVPLMSYLVMPLLTKWFASWLRS